MPEKFLGITSFQCTASTMQPSHKQNLRSRGYHFSFLNSVIPLIECKTEPNIRCLSKRESAKIALGQTGRKMSPPAEKWRC